MPVHMPLLIEQVSPKYARIARNRSPAVSENKENLSLMKSQTRKIWIDSILKRPSVSTAGFKNLGKGQTGPRVSKSFIW